MASAPHPSSPRRGSAADSDAGDFVTKLAILAVGGQGGGVLTDWIVAVAEHNGFCAQSTSVAGVAQRTGATIYYIEMAPDHGRHPVFALSPAEGDVDILIAAEWMEAGRAILRGFVTPDRTTLIASSHRIAAVSEKIAPGDGRASSHEVDAAARIAAKRVVSFDMERIAVAAGSVISSSLFGALAGCGALPFPRDTFEATIHGSGRGVSASLAAFAAAFEIASRDGSRMPLAAVGEPDAAATDRRAAATGTASVTRVAGQATDLPTAGFERPADAPLPLGGQPESEDLAPASEPAGAMRGSRRLLARWSALAARIDRMPPPVREMARAGLAKVVDYQDLAYGVQYLDRLDAALAANRGTPFAIAAAKHLANALVYDDIIRVADLKTRARRSARVRRELGVATEDVLRVTEYFHPRVEEVCATLPAGIGRWIEARPGLTVWLDRRVNRGRHVRTDRLSGFVTLWLIAGLRPFRRRLLRHDRELAHVEAWWRLALRSAERDPALGLEVLNCRRLIKGYSDTHARGLSKYDRVLSAVPLLVGRPDAAEWLRRLRDAALKDEEGAMLNGALRTVASFAQPSGHIVPERDGPAAATVKVAAAAMSSTDPTPGRTP